MIYAKKLELIHAVRMARYAMFEVIHHLDIFSIFPSKKTHQVLENLVPNLILKY